MTVNEMIAALQKLQQDGHGELPVASSVEYMGYNQEFFLVDTNVVRLDIKPATPCKSDPMEGRQYVKIVSKDY